MTEMFVTFTRKHFSPRGERGYGYSTAIGWFLHTIILTCMLAVIVAFIWGLRMFWL